MPIPWTTRPDPDLQTQPALPPNEARCRLSVNVNKIALLRNARGGQNPDLLWWARHLEHWGGQGITVHPRPDERHVRYQDLPLLAAQVQTELNVEGYPDDAWMAQVLAIRPAQATLVPDPPTALTSSAGWNTIKERARLTEICDRLREAGIRSSIFIDAEPSQAQGAARCGADRVELYTGPYAEGYLKDRGRAIEPFTITAREAYKAGLELNAGHDLNLDNLAYMVSKLPYLIEVSIGHALVCDALLYGMENVIRMYLRQIALGEME